MHSASHFETHPPSLILPSTNCGSQHRKARTITHKASRQPSAASVSIGSLDAKPRQGFATNSLTYCRIVPIRVTPASASGPEYPCSNMVCCPIGQAHCMLRCGACGTGQARDIPTPCRLRLEKDQSALSDGGGLRLPACGCLRPAADFVSR